MKILVVEDQFKLARSLKRGLEQEGFAVDTERDFISGLSAAQANNYDILVLDRMLPGGDGLDIVKELRKQSVKTPCLMLTAKDAVTARVEGLDGGADDYLIKPFAFDELIARVYSLLRRPHEHVGTEILCGDVKLNPQNKTVYYKKYEIKMTKKEFSILEYLMRNQNTVVSKQSLIDHIWDFDADVLPNTVEAFVNSIRKKLDKKYKTNVVQTVRGHGYKVDC